MMKTIFGRREACFPKTGSTPEASAAIPRAAPRSTERRLRSSVEGFSVFRFLRRSLIASPRLLLCEPTLPGCSSIISPWYHRRVPCAWFLSSQSQRSVGNLLLNILLGRPKNKVPKLAPKDGVAQNSRFLDGNLTT